MLSACGDEPAAELPGSTPLAGQVGRFVVRPGADGGLEVLDASDLSRALLPARRGGGPFAPLAARHADATFEAQYGAFLITDGPGDWRSGTRLTAVDAPAGEVRIEARDATGELVAELHASSPTEGALRLQVTAARADDNRLAMTFGCTADEHFLGFGAQADALDHRGHVVPIWTSEPGIGKLDRDFATPDDLWFLEGARHASSFGLPSWLSSRGFVGAVNDDHRQLFDLCATVDDAFRIEVWSGTAELWLYDGPHPADALERATAGVLGRPARPPPFAFAPWNDAIFGSENVRRVAARLREADVPTSAIWTEDFRGGYDAAGQGYRLKEEWQTDRTLYPDVEALAAELSAQGIGFFAYFNTFLVEETAVFAEAQAGGHFVQDASGAPYLFDGITFVPTGLADLSRPATRDWVKGYLDLALSQGFTGFMADFAEWLPADARLASGEDPLAAHNRYPLEWVKLCQEALQARASDGVQRLFFARAGWLGSTAYTPVVWAGDQRTDFQRDDGLPTVIPLGLGLGLGGVSTYGSDIAGYQSATNPIVDEELFFRWVSLGALTPVMRTHHGTAARENFQFDSSEAGLAHFRRRAIEHVRLFPYLDGGAAVAEARGLPLVRALPLEFPADPAGWTIADQYLLGPSLLVAPVIERDARARTLHLPPGRWTPREGGPAVTGPAELTVDAALAELPLFVRDGAIIPLLPARVRTLLPAEPPVVDLEDVEGERVLLVAAGTGSFAERDGTTYRLAPGGDAAAGERRIGGAILQDCPDEAARGCLATSADDGAIVRLDAAATLAFDGHLLTIDGPARTIDVRILSAP